MLLDRLEEWEELGLELPVCFKKKEVDDIQADLHVLQIIKDNLKISGVKKQFIIDLNDLGYLESLIIKSWLRYYKIGDKYVDSD